jgi:transposase
VRAVPASGGGRPPLRVRLDRDLPYPPDQVRSVTLVYDAGRLWVDVTAEVPVACYPAGQEPDPGRVAGVDLGIIHPYAVAGPDGQALLVSGRAVRAEHRMHLADGKNRRKAVARRAPRPGQRGSRRWPGCQFSGHRDLSAAASIAARLGGGITPVVPAGVTHRRAGAHLPGVAPSRRDPGRHRSAQTSPPLAGPGAARHPARSLNTPRNYRQVH